MYRFTFAICLTLMLSACANGLRPGKKIFTEDTQERYVELRHCRAGYVLSTGGEVENRPDLKDLREVHGDLEFICSEIHGIENPRLVIESKNKKSYQVVYKRGDRDALKAIAMPLGLLVTQEEREIPAFTIRESSTGHRLKPASGDKQTNVEEVGSIDGQWPLEGVTVDLLARFLETRYRRPVVNLTGVEGAWSILLSEQAGKIWPKEKAPLDDLGLDLQEEKVKVLVTVVKDLPR